MLSVLSLAGIGVFILIAMGLSENRRAIVWQNSAKALALTLCAGAVVFLGLLQLPAQYNPFLILNDVILVLLQAAASGSEFLFGPLALESELGFILAFQVLPIILFFSALVSLLYHLGIMQRVVRAFARVFYRFLGISGAEAVCVASNIFVGVESLVSIRPYLSGLSRSELATIMTSGMATIASSTLALYVVALNDQFPGIAAHLVSASMLSAPAAILYAKILIPETAVPETVQQGVAVHYERAGSFVEAIIQGANAGVKLIVGVGSLLIAVLGLVALVNILIGWLGGLVGQPELSLSMILGWISYIPTVFLGIPLNDVSDVAPLLGMRMIETEVPGYFGLGALLQEGAIATRTGVVTAYALCGFAHLASLAIFTGGISALVPEQTAKVASVGLRAFIAAQLACLTTGAVAGLYLWS